MLFCSLIAAAGLLSGRPDAGVSIARVFAKGERLQYQVKSTLNAQERGRGLETWIPSDFEIQYKFNLEVLNMKQDGIAEIRYLRPNWIVIDGETVSSPPKTTVDKINFNYLLTVSPINEILAEKDETKKPPKKAGGDGGDGGLFMRGGSGKKRLQDPFGFIQGVHQLALFVGGVGSGLDFAPKLPFEQIVPGATWKRTVGYSAQKTKSTNGKSVVQRLDYTYTYQGVVESHGKKVYRVTAELALDSNVVDFIHDTYELKPDDTGLKALPLKLKAKIEFDLDMATRRTIRADANSEGGYKVILTAYPDDPVQEEMFKGHTTLELLASAGK